MQKEMKRAIDAIQNSQRIAIASHIAPDGDNVGAVLACAAFLDGLGKSVSVIKTDDIPEYLQFLPGLNRYEHPYDVTTPYDLFIALDCADRKRLGVAEEFFLSARNTLQLDHHKTNPGYAKINLIEPEASSTCEVLYELITEMERPVTAEMATVLYAGIGMDTGRFLYSNTSKRTLEIVENLIETGFDRNSVNQKLWQSKTLSAAKLYMKALSRVKFFENNTVAGACVTLQMAKECGTGVEDTEDIVHFIRDIEGVRVAYLIKEKKDCVYKVSLRSKNDVDVSKIAQCFGGGGHARASGLTFHGEREELESRLLAEIRKSL